MLVSEVIQHIKDYSTGIDSFTNEKIDELTTRDQITWKIEDTECTGIVTCIWPTVDIIKKAKSLGANLIITHEALFWNHGDHQDRFPDNEAFEKKIELLKDWGGCVWRCHDYIHSRVPLEADGSFVDGIFYGLAHKLGWIDNRIGDKGFATDYQIEPIPAYELAHFIVEKLGLQGTRIIGNPNTLVSRIHTPMHVLGDAKSDTYEINYVQEHHVDCLLAMEFCDFTTSEFIRDRAMLGIPSCAIVIGHFNLEQPGMEYMVQWIPKAIGTDVIPITYVPMGDTYSYII